MSEELKLSEDKMSKTLDSLKEEFKTIRTGRPNPEIFKKVKAECYGSVMQISDLASISVPDGQSFLIQPFDKSNLKAIEQAIRVSDLGLNPTSDGSVIRIIVPPLSKDRRDELIKKVHKLTEDRGRVPVRRIRQEAKDSLKKLKTEGVSEDEIKKLQDSLEKITTKYIAKIDDMAKEKEQDLLKI